jgi:tRNA G37 N-methylase Trm5
MDRGGMILGMYEQEVITTLNQNRGRILINLGAGDGFYSIGGVKSGLFEESIAFEMRSESQSLIIENARLNGVEKNKRTWSSNQKFLD